VQGKAAEARLALFIAIEMVELDPSFPPPLRSSCRTDLLLSSEIADGGMPRKHRTRKAACFLGLKSVAEEAM
jgi:hypothetical protein